MFVTGLFFNATVHTTLPLTSSFLISLAVQFLCVSRFCFCVLSGAVYVYVCMCLCMCMHMEMFMTFHNSFISFFCYISHI